MYVFIVQWLLSLYLYHGASSQYMPSPYQMAQMPMRMPMPGMPGAAPAMMPMPMSAPAMPYPMPTHQKMPMVVMPFYSKKADQKNKKRRSGHKKRRRQKYHRIDTESGSSSASCDSASSESSGENYRKSSRRSRKKSRRQVLTPVVSYVTKDGYVIYQKKIRKDKARDWLQLGEKNKAETKSNEVLDSDDEAPVRKKKKSKSRRH